MGFDIVWANWARNNAASEPLGYTETKTFVVPENLEGLDLFGVGILFGKSSSDFLDLRTVVGINVTYSTGQRENWPITAENVFEDGDGVLSIVLSPESSNAVACVISVPQGHDVDAGVYIQLYDGARIDSLKYSVVHTIDPKCLPGVCLPVVELSVGLITGNAALTDAEKAALSNVDGPCIICAQGAGVKASSVATYLELGATKQIVFLSGDGDRIVISTNDGNDWAISTIK